MSAYSPNALQSGIALARGGFNPNRTMGVDPATGRLTFIASPGSPEADEDPFTQGSVAFYPKPLDQMDPSQVIHEGEHVGQNEWTGGLSEIFSKALGAMLPSGHQTNPAVAAAYGATAAAGFPYDQSAAETFRSTTNPVEKLITSVLGGDIPPAPVRPPALVPGSPEWQARFGASSSPADQTPPAWQGPPLPAAAWQGPPVPPDVLPTTDYEFNEALPDVLPTDPRFGSNPNNPANSLLASPVAGPQPTTHITAPARRTSGTRTNNNGGVDAAAARDHYF
ncbi:MAG: hypothetical protein ACREJF_06980, partial [Candidatus Methylomirabilales bacterium]